jgi:hypothetical protein
MNTEKFANVVGMDQMLDLLTDFFNTLIDRRLVVGGCAGTTILKDVMDTATAYCEFKKILVLDGCCDNVVSMTKPIINYMYYADLFAETIVDSIHPFDPFKPTIMNPSTEYRKVVDTTLMSYYECIIINNAHYIPSEYIQQIYCNFAGKIVCIVDPFDVNGELFARFPTVVDTLIKQSPKIATARNLYGIDTRGIDKRIRGVIEHRKVSKRTIGRMDDNQYVTDSVDLTWEIRKRQYETTLRRRHKLLVTSNHLFMYPDQSGGRRCITRDALLIASTPTARPYGKYRIHASKLIIQADVSYTDDASGHIMHVTPANILHVNDCYKHKFGQIVFVQTERTNQTRRQYYSLLKNSINLIICKG